MREINRIKAVLIEQEKTGKWLADNLGKDVARYPAGVIIMPNPQLKLLFALRSYWILT